MSVSNPTAPASSLNRVSRTNRLVALAMLCAISYVVMFFLRIPLWSFLKYDPKDIVIVIGGFIYGPFSAFLVAFVVSMIEMISVSETGWIGFFMNILSTASFACVAALVYSKMRTKKGAIIGLILGVALMTVVMILWNYIITPYYMETPREVVASMLVPIFLPFNLFKGFLNMGLTLILYKPIMAALRKANLIPEQTKAEGKEKTLSLILPGAVMVATVALLVMAFNGSL